MLMYGDKKKNSTAFLLKLYKFQNKNLFCHLISKPI